MALNESQPKPRELKPEQADAARTLDHHVTVTAGPGAGKTTVLVERYLEILRTQKHVSVDNIVAITFTNRAANQMRQKVRAEIDELLRTADEKERPTWLRHKRALEGAVITTIHSFCSRLLHEFPVEANVDPQFSWLDEHQAAMMLEAIVEETLGEAIQRNEKIVTIAQGVGRSALARTLADLYLKYRGEGLALNDIKEKTAANHASQSQYSGAFKELDARVSDLISTRRLSPDAERKRATIAREWPAVRDILSTPPDERTIAAYCQAIEDLWDARLRKGSTPAVEQVDELLWGTNPSKGDRLRGRVAGLGFDLLAKDYALAIIQLMVDIDRRLESEKQRISVLDFDDLQLRTLKFLNEHPETLNRLTERYRFFLVDEFQDTNGLQRDLMKRLGLVRGTNLFIVGDRKQSVYGFRGADVDVFSEMTDAIRDAGGVERPLQLNFRSQKPLIDSMNFLFERIFHMRHPIEPDALAQLGYVSHEPSVAVRSAEHQPPLIELMTVVLPDPGTNTEDDDDDRDLPDVRERDAAQVAERISSLIKSGEFEYRNIAILFRAMTGTWTYESRLRRAGIPFLTVQGKGFYQREEVTDLIQLLRFLDNTTDELALAAVLRSPLCGISDNALLALRCAPGVGETPDPARLQRRNLLRAVRHHRELRFIDEEEHLELDRAANLLESAIERRNRYSISELLRFAVAATEFTNVIAANFDGAQRIANIEKLYRLAEQFEQGGHLIRDFVHYVEEFEAIGGRESEGQMDESANVVRLMTIHQAKGLEFPVVIIPDLHREQKARESWYALDRHKGFTIRIPDGRGQTVRGSLFNDLRQRTRWREEFESMRLLYVAATRAEDRLILTGAITRKELKNLCTTRREQWLAWIWQALELDEHPQTSVLKFSDEVEFQITIDREPAVQIPRSVTNGGENEIAQAMNRSGTLTDLFPLLQRVPAERGKSLRRFSVTQLINFQRCARQYYFDRTLRAPGTEELAVWNDAEAPEPPANLTATLKGAVIHRFCETFSTGDDLTERLRESLEDVIRQRESELGGRAFDINHDEAVRDLSPLAQHYLDSDVFQRASRAARIQPGHPQSSKPGLWSELRFRLRRPMGILTGTIDKLLVTPAAKNGSLDVEIIDFKTNRFRATRRGKTTAKAIDSSSAEFPSQAAAQGLFNFDEPVPSTQDLSIEDQIDVATHDYQLQMQAYSLAVRELIGSPEGAAKIKSIRATLHFLDPNREASVARQLLELETCAEAIDQAMARIASLEGTLDDEQFPANPASHCRMCNFLDLCPAGRDWLRNHRSR